MRDSARRFPHVAFRAVNDTAEAYVEGAGIAVWELAWLARSFEDAETLARETLVDRALVAEALRYAGQHPQEIDAAIRRHTEVTLEELRVRLPGIRVVSDHGRRKTPPSE